MRRLARLGEHGEECVKYRVNSMPSAMRRSRHGRWTEAGNHPRWRSWSETTRRMLGRRPGPPAGFCRLRLGHLSHLRLGRTPIGKEVTWGARPHTAPVTTTITTTTITTVITTVIPTVIPTVRRAGHHRHRRGLMGLVASVVLPHDHGAHSGERVLESTADGIRAVALSLAILAVTAVVELVVALLSHSVALLADTIHNFADALTALPLALAFKMGRRRPTRRYTYGFGRAEDLAGIAIVAIIAASTVVAAYEAVDRLMHPRPINGAGWVMAAGGVGFLGNELVAMYRVRVGRRIGSAALVADGLHARSDGFTSLAVVVGAVAVARRRAAGRPHRRDRDHRRCHGGPGSVRPARSTAVSWTASIPRLSTRSRRSWPRCPASTASTTFASAGWVTSCGPRSRSRRIPR